MSTYAFVVSLFLRMAKPLVIEGSGRPGIRAALLLVKVAKRQTPAVLPTIRAVQLVLKYARPAYPDMTWLEDGMFLENVVFPYNISNGSDASEVFSTNINTVDSGHEHRIGRWDQPLLSYNVAMGVRSLEDLHQLKIMFRIARGPRFAFRFRDPVDYTSSFAVAEDSRAPDPITPFDQIIGIGDGGTFTYRLVKTYEMEDQVSVRPIMKPEPGSVVIAVRGVVLNPVDFTVDYTSGLVTLLERTPATVATATLTRLSSRVRQLSWEGSESLGTLQVGDFVRIVGFYSPLNNITLARAWEITSMSAVDSTMTFTLPEGYDLGYGINEGPVSLVTITPLHVPLVGFEVTAGYRFHVPVRFQDDRLPLRLDYYGGGSADVALIEVRGDEV